MPISEQDAILALQAARAFSDDPAKVAKAKTIHDAYKRQQEAAGKPLWPETERAKVEDATKMRAMFQDRERHGFDEETFSEFSTTFPDPEKKARFLNSQFLSRVFQRSTDEIRSLGTQYRDEYAKQTWGEPVKTEGEFYEKLAGDFDLEDEIGKAAQDAALSGTSELDALSKFDFENVENPAYTARKDHRRQQFSKAFQAVKSELSGLEPTARVFTDQLKKQMGASGEAGAALPDEWFVETVMSLPKEKRDVFLSIVAKRGGEGEQKTLFQAMAERFGRQATSMVRNVGTASILKGLDEMGRQVIAGKLSASELPEEFGIEPFDFLAGEAKDNRAPKSEISGIRVPVEGSDEFAALPPEKQEALRRLERERDYLLTYEKINRIATGAVDAAEGSNYYAKGLLGISSSAPNILLAGAGPVGIGLNVKSYQDQALVDISDANPGLSMSTARAMAGVQGLGQGLIDMIPAKIAAGKLPGVTRWMNQAVATGKSAATRAGVRAIGGATFEAGVELTQDVGIPGAVQSLAAALDEDVPGYNWGERFAEFTSEESLSELIPSFLALSLIGAGVGSVRDFKSARSLLADPDWLKAMKISEAGTSEIRAKVIAGDMEGAQTLFREEFRKSGEDQKPLQQAAAEAIPRLIEQREALRELVNRAGDIDLLPAIRNNGEGSWSLEYNDGSGISFQTYEEADARRWQVASDENLSLHEDTRETIRRIDSDLEAGRELKYLFALDAPTLGDAQARGDVTAEDAANRLDIADATTPELDAEFEEATVAANLAGLSREERAASARILGSSTNEFRDGIVRTTMRLYQGATPLTIIEEKTEGDAKFMVRQLGLRKWMVSSLREWERVTGDRVFRAVAAGEETDQDIVEAWSAMAQAYFIGRNKDGEGVGWNRAKLAKALQTQLAGPLTGYARLFNAVLKRAAMIEKAKVEGTFDGDLEQFLERSTGMSEQRRFERAVVKEGGGIANELSQTDSKSIDGATFSIADFSDSRAQPQDGDVTLFQDGTRLVGPTTFSILAYHGTPHKVDKFSTENIGTGEGAQAYGWGLYFAENREVGEQYKKQLSSKYPVSHSGVIEENGKYLAWVKPTDGRDVQVIHTDATQKGAKNALKKYMADKRGNLYTVELLPDESDFLDWDKPLSEQSEYIKRTVEPIVRKYILENDAIVRQEFKDSVSEGSVLGSKLYQTISGERQIETRATDSRKAGSEFLLESGIKGIRYLDGNSRNQGQGSYNYVIFDENDIEILEENGQPVKREEVGPTFSILPDSESDARYLELAKDPEGNRVELQRMVDEAAKKAGYNVGPVFHGTNARFTVFSKGGRLGIYATPDESLARQYGERVLRIFAKVNRGARIDAELTTAESAKSGVDQLVSLLEKFDAIQAYPKEGNREILFREDVSLKSADPITYDESGNVIPLSRRFDSTRDEITYSLLPSSATDTEYLAAVESGDMVTAQRMVDEAARAAGYSQKVFHATIATENFSVFDLDRTGDNTGSTDVRGVFLSDSEATAASYIPTDRVLEGDRLEEYLNLSQVETNLRTKAVRNWEKKVSSGEITGYKTFSEPTPREFSEYLSREDYAEFVTAYNRLDEFYSDFQRENPRIYSDKQISGRVMRLFVNPTDFLQFDAGGRNWTPDFWKEVNALNRQSGGDAAGYEVTNFYDGPSGVRDTVRVAFNPNQIKSADPVTYDESGQVIPLSQRFNPARDEITYSLLPDASNLDTEFSRMFSPFQRSPELRMKLGFEMRDRAIGISRQVAPIIRANRTKGSIEAERKTRENDIFGEKLEALGGAFVSQLDAANLDDASARPILAELLRRKTYQRKDGKVVSYWGGSLMSKGEAKRRGMDTTGGEWDDIPEGLPGYVWGGGLSPDQAAAMLGFDSIPAFWTALQSEIDSFKAIQQQAEEANREISRLRKEAREESQTWADRALKDRETVGTDRATLLAFLRTLEAITRALPAEVRGKIGGAVALARLKGPGAMLDEIEDRVEKIDRELEKWMRDEAEARRKKLFKQAKPARDKSGKAPKGKAGADIHSLFDRLREALLWDGDTAEAWAVGLEAKAAGGELSVEEEAHARIEANLVRLFSDWKNADAARRTAAVDAAHTVFLNGYLEEQKRVAAERERREAARQEIRATVGKLGKRAERVAKAQQDAGFSGKIKEGFLSLFNFEQVAGFALGEGSKWARWFANAERTASAQYTDETQSTLDGLDDLFTELGGGTRLGGERLQWKLSQPSFDTAQGGRMSELQGLTALLMWRQEDGRRHMGGKRDDAGNVTSSWSYDESFIREIEANLSTEAFAVLDYLTEQYAGEWETLNPIFRELNGIDLPRHANYAPLSARPQQAPGGQTQDPLSGSMNSASMTPGSLRTRAQTIAEPDFVNAVEKFVSHKKQLAHWKAYALFNRDAQAILGNREVGNSIEAKGGAEAVSVLRKWLDYFAQGGVRDAGAHLALNRALSSMVGRASAMQLVGRVGTLLVQVTQLGAAPAKMPTGAYVARLSKLLTGNLGWGAALDSPYIQRRLATMPPSVQIAMEGLRAGKPNAIKHAAQRLGRLIAGADALFTAGTFAMVHDYQFSRLVKSGVDPVAANELALAEAERITDEIAQPTRAGARSLFEVTTTNPLGRLAWAFGSEARKNAALLAYSAMQRTPTEAARAALYVFLFNAGISTLIRTAWRDARDDEEKETDWDPRKLLLSAMAEPLYGIPVVGDAAQDAIFSAAGQLMPQGGLIQLKNAPGAVGDIFTGEGDSRDVETILMTLGLGNDSFAAAASLMHLYRDAEALIRNATN